MGGRVSFLQVIAAGVLLIVATVGGYWAAYGKGTHTH